MFATDMAATSEFWIPMPETLAGISTSTLPRSGEIGESEIATTLTPRSRAASIALRVERAYGGKLNASSTSPARMSTSGPVGTGFPLSSPTPGRTRSSVTAA